MFSRRLARRSAGLRPLRRCEEGQPVPAEPAETNMAAYCSVASSLSLPSDFARKAAPGAAKTRILQHNI